MYYLAIETITYDQFELQDLYSDCFHTMKLNTKLECQCLLYADNVCPQ